VLGVALQDGRVHVCPFGYEIDQRL
jgi:hypothetical protein